MRQGFAGDRTGIDVKLYLHEITPSRESDYVPRAALSHIPTWLSQL
jgi:hypothetical protein